MESGTANLLHLLQERVMELREEENWTEAICAVEAALEKAQAELDGGTDATDEFVTCLEIRGDLRRRLGELEEARDDFSEALEHLEGRTERLDQVGRLHAGVAACCEARGRLEEAAAHYEKAVEAFENSDPPSSLDAAAMLNNLAFLRRDSGDFDAAETAFLKALEYYYSICGANHEETADICNNVGALYHRAGFLVQAREMHLMALKAREELLGQDHADTAQSHNNLALTLAESGEIEKALVHFEAALQVFAAGGEAAHDDLEAVVENYGHYLRELGRDSEAEALFDRIGEAVAAGA